MKYLQDYIEEKQSKLFKECNAFFAFSDKQLEEGKKDGIKYVSMGMGLICETSKATFLMDQLDVIQEEGIQQDIKENGIPAIIIRELYNYECFYTGDCSDAFEKLKPYKIKLEEMQNAFYKEMQNADL